MYDPWRRGIGLLSMPRVKEKAQTVTARLKGKKFGNGKQITK